MPVHAADFDREWQGDRAADKKDWDVRGCLGYAIVASEVPNPVGDRAYSPR